MLLMEIKIGTKIKIGENVYVRFERIKGVKARIWVEAPNGTPIRKVPDIEVSSRVESY